MILSCDFVNYSVPSPFRLILSSFYLIDDARALMPISDRHTIRPTHAAQ